MRKSLQNIIVSLILIFCSVESLAGDVGIINFEVLMTKSKVGTDLMNKADKAKEAFTNKFKKSEQALLDEKNKLEKEQAILSKDAFEAKKAAFEKKIQSFQTDFQKSREALESANNKAVADIDTAIKKIAQDKLKEKSVSLIIPTSFVFVSDGTKDLTQEILTELDKSTKSVNFDYKN